MKAGWMVRVGLLGFFLSIPAVAATQRELPDLVTDRPDITESSAVVGRGVWQLESGISFERDGSGSDGSRVFSAPMALVRLGVSDRLELRIGADGLAWVWLMASFRRPAGANCG